VGYYLLAGNYGYRLGFVLIEIKGGTGIS
jgi:hypothetical protein